MKFFPALLIITACLNRAERQPSGNTTSRPVGPTLALRSAIPVATSDTGFWSDTNRVGDTLWHTKGRVVTSQRVLTDSTWFQLFGIPFGLFGTWNGTKIQSGAEVLTMAYGGTQPDKLLDQIATARKLGIKMVTTMAGGARCNYLTPVCVKNAKGTLVPQATSVFDMRKWVAAMRQYDTPALRVAVANAVRDGIIVANVVIDEPQNDGGPGNEGNRWGPKGTLNTVRVDSLCTESKRINATLPAGPFQDYSVTATDEWKGQQYRVCDFAASQYRTAKGTLTAYRAGALSEWKRQGIAGAIGINVTDGGTPASRRKPDGTVKTDYAAGDCAQSSPGSYFPNCTMTPQQFRSTVDTLGSIACFLTGFKFVASYVAANQQSFRDAVTALQNRPRISCLRG